MMNQICKVSKKLLAETEWMELSRRVTKFVTYPKGEKHGTSTKDFC